jgi:hypothetical protein
MQLEASEREIAELKLERTDLLNHVKMSNKIKKSKYAVEISQGTTLIFDTGQAVQKKGSRKK